MGTNYLHRVLDSRKSTWEWSGVTHLSNMHQHGIGNSLKQALTLINYKCQEKVLNFWAEVTNLPMLWTEHNTKTLFNGKPNVLQLPEKKNYRTCRLLSTAVSIKCAAARFHLSSLWSKAPEVHSNVHLPFFVKLVHVRHIISKLSNMKWRIPEMKCDIKQSMQWMGFPT